MSSRKSIYLSDAAEAVLGEPDTMSGRINSIILRYDAILREATPVLTEAEWSAIVDALNGTIVDENSLRHIWAEIADADRLNGIGAKWNIDAQGLSAQLQGMTTAQLCAVAEVVHRFWTAPGLNDTPTGERLRQSGATIR